LGVLHIAIAAVQTVGARLVAFGYSFRVAVGLIYRRVQCSHLLLLQLVQAENIKSNRLKTRTRTPGDTNEDQAFVALRPNFQRRAVENSRGRRCAASSHVAAY
jgi:hypothetical protein